MKNSIHSNLKLKEEEKIKWKGGKWEIKQGKEMIPGIRNENGQRRRERKGENTSDWMSKATISQEAYNSDDNNKLIKEEEERASRFGKQVTREGRPEADPSCVPMD